MCSVSYPKNFNLNEMNKFRYLISGGSGWLGTELVYALLRTGQVSGLNEIKLLSSTPKKMTFGEFGSIETKAYFDQEFENDIEIETFVHLAFLTRDKLNSYSRELFLNINDSITQRAAFLIEKYRPKFVANVSSGAVFSRENLRLETTPSKNPYGYGKLFEEQVLTEVCNSQSINLAIGRLWGATGQYMPTNPAYAVSNFILEALKSRSITIQSGHTVWRRYCNAGEFMLTLIKASQQSQYTLFDSGGPKVEIGELAHLIKREISEDINIARNQALSNVADEYFPTTSSYEKLNTSLGVGMTNLVGQIRKTIEGHVTQLGM